MTRLLSITNISTGHVTRFRYDGLNRRVAIDETLGNTTTETDYLWCGAQLCAAYDTSGNLIARYAPQGEAEYSGSAQTNLYYQRDYLGSVVGVTDSNGNSLGQLITNAYGRPLSQTGTVPTFGFAGMFLHQPSGLYLTLNRAYDPTTGRWLSRDPAGELANPRLNLYAYANNNPVNTIDPLGQWGVGVIAGGSAEGGAGVIGAGVTASVGVGYFSGNGNGGCVGGFAMAAAIGLREVTCRG